MRKLGVISLIIHSFLTGIVFGQFYEESRMSGVGTPFFTVEVFRTIAEDFKKGKIFIYSQIVRDDLTFVKDDTTTRYHARFEWEVSVMDDDEEKRFGTKNIARDIYANSYDETNDREDKIFLNTDFEIPPGDYIIFLEMRDLNTKKRFTREVETEMFDVEDEAINMSDILFVDEIKPDSGDIKKRYRPRVQNNFSRESPLVYIYTEVYSEEVPATLSLHYQLQNKEEEVELDTVVVAQASAPLTSFIMQIDKRKLTRSFYRVYAQLKRGSDHVERSRPLTFYWVSLPETHEDLSSAIKQMRYILDSDSLDYYEEEATTEEQQKFFTKFWKSRDPNPETDSNELMEEYFSRVNFANREFSSYSDDGWLSDRGRILIKFGYPDDVERHPFEMNSVPYVIWRYFGLRKVFVFADRSGFGDYRLLPAYQGEEYR
jgi:GWxTD domain-containing protein